MNVNTGLNMNVNTRLTTNVNTGLLNVNMGSLILSDIFVVTDIGKYVSKLIPCDRIPWFN